MNQIMMMIFAAGAILGGTDYMAGNRKGYGAKFEEGFLLLGPTALSMAGIICITPALSWLIGKLIIPLCGPIHVDPAMAGGLLAIDMGGYQMAAELAEDASVGLFSGIIVGSVFGCTITFTLPVGMGVIGQADYACFLKGTIIGLITMPFGFLMGGLVCGSGLFKLLRQLSPVLFLAVLLAVCLWKKPERTIRLFQFFVRFLKTLITSGLILGTVCYLLKLDFPWLTPVMDSMQVVVSICVTLLGSLPAALFLQRLLRRPLHTLGRRIGLEDNSITALLIGTVSVLPALTMLRDMNSRGKTAVSAWLVSAASLLGAHIAFTASAAPQMTGALIAAKLSGAFLALLISLFLC